jgi:hypothetical protein
LNQKRVCRAAATARAHSHFSQMAGLTVQNFLSAATGKALKRTKAMGLRVEASQRRTDKRDWMMHRRERIRHLIELGGLVQKAGLVELTDDDRAVLLGAFLAVADKLQSDERDKA